jgi:hypothetical protein
MTSWLTYADAAERFGISSEAVRQLAIRHHWPRRKPNGDLFGRVQVCVPDDFEPRPRTPVERPNERLSDTRSSDDTEPDRADKSHEIIVLEAAITALSEARDEAVTRAQAAEQRADGAMALADRTLAHLADAQARGDRADAALADERVRSDQVRAQVDELRAQLAELRADDAARQARGLLARLRDAWRGG